MCTFSEFKLPPADGTPDDGEFENLKYSISRMGRAFTTEEFRLTKAAIAGMVGHEAKDYEPGQCIASVSPIFSSPLLKFCIVTKCMGNLKKILVERERTAQ